MSFFSTIFIATCALLIESGPGRADAKSVNVAEPEFSGAFEEGAERRLREHLIEGVRRSDAGLTIGDAGEADYEVRSKVVKQDRDYELELELRDAAGQTISSAEQVCEICGEAEVGQMLEAIATRVASQVAGDSAASELSVHSRPPGARVLVDGEPVGVTPVRLELPPGKHELSITREDFSPAQRTIVLEAGVRTRTEIELLPVSKTRKFRPWGIVALAVGIPTTSVGAGLLAYDGRPDRGRCNGEDVDADGDCRYVHRFKTGGAIMIGAGVALTAAGVALLVAASQRKGTRGSSRRASLAKRRPRVRWQGPIPKVRF